MSLRSRSNRRSTAPILVILASCMALIAMHGAGSHSDMAGSSDVAAVDGSARTHHAPEPRPGQDEVPPAQPAASMVMAACIAVVAPAPADTGPNVAPTSVRSARPPAVPESRCLSPDPPVPRMSSIT